MNKEKKVIRLGTRKSPLAMAQARLAAEAIERAFPELTAELVPIVTRGDRILDRPLVEMCIRDSPGGRLCPCGYAGSHRRPSGS